MRGAPTERIASCASRVAWMGIILLLAGGGARAETFDRSICVSPSQNDRVVRDASELKSRLPQFDLVGFRPADLSLRTLVKEKIRKFSDFVSPKTDCSDGKCTIRIDGGRVQGQIQTTDVLECYSTLKSCAKGVSDCDAVYDQYVETIYWPGGVVTLRQSRLSHETSNVGSDLTARGILAKHADQKDSSTSPVYSEVFDLDRHNSLELELVGSH